MRIRFSNSPREDVAEAGSHYDVIEAVPLASPRSGWSDDVPKLVPLAD
jgi:hypothetical protein